MLRNCLNHGWLKNECVDVEGQLGGVLRLRVSARTHIEESNVEHQWLFPG